MGTFKVNTFKATMKQYNGLINEISNTLEEEFKRQRNGETAWIFREPERYNTLQYSTLVENNGVNLLSVIDLLQIYCDKYNMSKTWNEIIKDALSNGSIDLAIYIKALKNFMKKYNGEIVFVYYTEMIMNQSDLEFIPNIVCIDLKMMKEKMQTENKSAWRLIKDNKLLIETKYENSNIKKINFWKEDVNEQCPQVYYRFIERDYYLKTVDIKTNLFVNMLFYSMPE